MLDLNDVCVTFYPNTSNERIALDHLSFHIDDGDFISVLGTNGAAALFYFFTNDARFCDNICCTFTIIA